MDETLKQKDEYGRNKLLRAALLGDVIEFKKLYKLYHDPSEEVDDNQNTVLHLAAMKGNLSIVQFLAEQNIDLNKQDKFGATALHLAAANGCNEVVRFLVGSEVMAIDLNIVDNKGRTALDVAAEKNKNNVLITLLRAGAISASSPPHENIAKAVEILKKLDGYKQTINSQNSTSPKIVGRSRHNENDIAKG